MDLAEIVQSVEQNIPGAVAEHPPAGIVIRPESVRAVFGFLKNGPLQFVSLQCLTAVDRRETLEVVYHLYSFEQRFMLTVKVMLPPAAPVVDSLTCLWTAADWLEREVYDLFGVRFIGHPDLRRIMNPDTLVGHPLRKDFVGETVIRRPVT